MTQPLGIGVVGTGFIARRMAECFAAADGYRMRAVCSRTQESAEAYRDAVGHPSLKLYDDFDEFVADAGLDAVYVATPTGVREQLCARALAASKSVLAEKPFASAASHLRLRALAERHGVAFMDATHFVHEARMQSLRSLVLSGALGEVPAARATFSFPVAESESSRYDPNLEPNGVLGDLGWYPLRAYTFFAGGLGGVARSIVRGKWSSSGEALVAVHGTLQFDDGRVFDFDARYDVSYVRQCIELLGTADAIVVDDFVLPHRNSLLFGERQAAHGYHRYHGIDPGGGRQFVEAPQSEPAHLEMLRFFHRLHAREDRAVARAAELGEEVTATMRLVERLYDSLARARRESSAVRR